MQSKDIEPIELDLTLTLQNSQSPSLSVKYDLTK